MIGETKKYWFPRKTYGWGWGIPTAWQGWVVLAAYLGGLVLLYASFPPATHSGAFMVGVAVLTAALVAICWLKGEPPGGWHWGD